MKPVNGVTHKDLLPVGDHVKALICNPAVTVAELKKLLRARGIVLNSESKADYVKVFLQVIMTASEFRGLLELVETKEEAPKYSNETYDLQDKNVSLQDIVMIQADSISSISNDPYGNFSLAKPPNILFSPPSKDGQKVVISYELERQQMGANIFSSIKNFKGAVELFIPKNSKKLQVTKVGSSPETKNINQAVTKTIIDDARSKKLVSNKDAVVIRFEDFSNANRIKFFMGCLADSENNSYSFNKLMHLSLKPDPEADLSEEERLAWTEDKVSSINLTGAALQDTFFIKDPKCHQYVLIWKIEARFDFYVLGAKGYFDVCLEFDGYARNQNLESRFQITLFTPKVTSSDLPTINSPESLRRRFLPQLEKARDKAYKVLLLGDDEVIQKEMKLF